jgi:Domain of unknown function (DUF4397)
MTIKRRGWRGLAGGIKVLLIVAALAALTAPLGVAAQDEITVETRAVFLHASPNLGEVEVSLNWETQLEEFGYGDQSDWVDVPPGAVEVTMNAERRGFNYLVFDVVYPAPAGNDYYCIITEQLVIAGAFDQSPIPDGGARVQVVQGSVSLPAVNVVATGEDAEWATQLQYPRTSEYSVVPAGTYDLEVKLADTGETVLTAPGVNLSGDTVNELVIMGNANDGDHPLEIKVLSDTTGERSGEDAGSSTPTS